MPAFNAGKYVAGAIESVLKQTYTDWELIIVDDKSLDDTYEIALDYASRDKRIRVYQLEKNSGSAQRPRFTAEKKARGEFICLLDADDVLDSKYLDKLLSRYKETKADAVLGRLCSMTENGIKQGPFNPSNRVDLNSIISGKDAFMLTVGSWEINGLGLYKRDVLDVASKQFNQLLDSINADELYTRVKFLACNNVAFCNADYFYRDNSESITKKFSIKLFDCLDAVNGVRLLTLKEFGRNSQEYSKSVLYLFSTILRCISLFFKKKDELTHEYQVAIKQKIHTNWDYLSLVDVLKCSVKKGIAYSCGFNTIFLAYRIRYYVRKK